MSDKNTPDAQVEKPKSLLEFNDNGININVRFDETDQSIWANIEDISILFSSSQLVVKNNIDNIFLEGELDKHTSHKQLSIIRKENGRDIFYQAVDYYNLDVILSIGYALNTKRASRFRLWATRILSAFIEQGYVLNESALRESPEKLNALAAKVRALRFEEKQIYAKVRECFKICSSDYNPSSQQVKSFYALLQDKFLHAITGMTSSKIIIDRADHKLPNMGISTIKGDLPTISEAKVGKNYLSEKELYRIHLLSEQFLLYAQTTALAQKEMTMESLRQQLDRLLILNDYPVFDGYKDYLKDEAIEHAKRELSLLKKRKKIESLGIEYKEELLNEGEYDELLMEYGRDIE